MARRDSPSREEGTKRNAIGACPEHDPKLLTNRPAFGLDQNQCIKKQQLIQALRTVFAPCDTP